MSLPELATRRRVTVGMLTLTLVLFGLIGLAGLKVNLLPDLSYPTLTVRTDYEGAAPLEIENLISQPVEEGVGAERRPIVSAARSAAIGCDDRLSRSHPHSTAAARASSTSKPVATPAWSGVGEQHPRVDEGQ